MLTELEGLVLKKEGRSLEMKIKLSRLQRGETICFFSQNNKHYYVGHWVGDEYFFETFCYSPENGHKLINVEFVSELQAVFALIGVK